MTHDELLDIIGHWNWIEPGAINALRAVVELHKPDAENNCVCQYDRIEVYGVIRNGYYPCETIQAIEKELK